MLNKICVFLLVWVSCFATEYCVVVDPYSSGINYAGYFEQMGYSCIYIKVLDHTPKQPEESVCDCAASWTNSRFFKLFRQSSCKQGKDQLTLVYDGQLDSLVEKLKTFSVAAVVAGSEAGVVLAEELCHVFNFRTNPPGTADCCRNKYLTAQCLQKKGIPSLKQALVRTKEEGVLWAKNYGKFPVVVKPIDSGGADGFHLCFSQEDVTRAIDDLIGKTTFLQTEIQAVLIQEYLHGLEYIVNTVSCRGKHYVQSIMVYEKRPSDEGGVIFETYTTLNPKEKHPEQMLTDYALEVLDALGIREGPTHCEIVMTERGPILIECNARPHGHTFPEGVMKQCFGHSQIELSALAALNETQFVAHTKQPYALKQHFSALHLIAHESGKIENIRFFDQIQRLPSYHLHRIYLKKGDRITKTHDLLSVPGDIFLLHSDVEQINNDTKVIRAFEKKGIFMVTPHV